MKGTITVLINSIDSVLVYARLLSYMYDSEHLSDFFLTVYLSVYLSVCLSIYVCMLGPVKTAGFLTVLTNKMVVHCSLILL